MNKRIPILLVAAIITIFLLLAYLFLFQKKVVAPTAVFNTVSPTPSPEIFKGGDQILKSALNLYARKKEGGVDFTNGPCLGKIADDWVLDIAHNPRQPVDDRQENQCADFKEGRAHHFIELDENGNLIKSF